MCKFFSTSHFIVIAFQFCFGKFVLNYLLFLVVYFFKNEQNKNIFTETKLERIWVTMHKIYIRKEEE